MNMNQIIEWVRSNVFTVIFIVVMIAAVVALPIIAGKMNAGVQEDVQSRLGLVRELESIERTSVPYIDPETGEQVEEQTTINESLLERYLAVVEQRRRDAVNVVAAAERHNERDHTVLMQDVFPEPPSHLREVIPARFHSALIEAHRELLDGIDAGMPPTLESMREDLERARRLFLTGQLQKEVGDSLDAREERELRDYMTETRLNRYYQAADSIGVYASLDALNLPAWDQARLPSLSELFQWQWDYWIRKDVLLALDAANQGSQTVLRAPVKQIISMSIFSDMPAQGSGRSGGSSAGMGAGSSAFGGGGSASGGSPDAGAGSGTPPNLKAPINPDYGMSITGRKSNPIYDVMYVDLSIVAETARLPEVLDALAKQNLMTVIDLKLASVNQFEAAEQGFLYGSGPVSQVTMRIETIWLRSWTAQYMPTPFKQARGVYIPSATQNEDQPFG